MESFRINVTLNNIQREVLVIPDDCTDMSIFHLVIDGTEFCKLRYSELQQWELIEEADIGPQELEEIGKSIEAHYN